MTKFTYIGVFSCPQLIGMMSPTIVKPAKLDILAGSEKIKIFRQWSRIHPIGVSHPAMTEEVLVLPKDKKLLRISVQAEEADVRLLESLLNQAITKLAVFIQPQLFFDVIYKGPIAGPEKKIAVMSVRPAERVELSSAKVERFLGAKPVDDLENRFNLMSNFYSRSLDYDPSPEKFFLLWTVLEIFPMKDTSNIGPLRDLVKLLTGGDKQIERNLDIGRLYGKRCEIVHDGKFYAATSSPDFVKLEALVHEAIRSILGLPYGGLLDRFRAA